MKLPQRHKEELLKEKEKIQNSVMTTFKGGYDWINPEYKDVIIENLQVTEFTQMYPHIMVMLHDEGLIDIPEESDKMKWFFQNVKNLKLAGDGEYYKWKGWVNSLYGLFWKQPKGLLIFGLISKYQYLLFDEILENNPEHIVYIDTDMILSVNPVNLGDCPFPHSTDTLTLGIINEKKRYIVHDGNELKIKGYPTRKHEEVKREVQSRIRQLQLEKLGIGEQLTLF
jgi:hypothetical protein